MDFENETDNSKIKYTWSCEGQIPVISEECENNSSNLKGIWISRYLMGKVLGLLFFWEHNDLIVFKWKQKKFKIFYLEIRIIFVDTNVQVIDGFCYLWS